MKFLRKTCGWRFSAVFSIAAMMAAATLSLSAQDQSYSVITTNRPVVNPARQTFVFEASGIFVSTEFDGARLNDLKQMAAGELTALIEPENQPVNDAAWYGFKIWAREKQTVHVTLNYKGGRHRYHPKVSHDRKNWRKLEGNAYKPNGTTNAVLRLEIGPDPLFVCGQELVTAGDFDGWMTGLARRKFVQRSVIGSSAAGRPIAKLEIGGREGSDCIFILGRQHPPEVTGSLALMTFVETISGNSRLAKEFRKQFRTVVIPFINPDGVADGHWRHNLGGVDLNRDWGQFHQPETRVVRDELQSIAKASGKVRFGIDFHSTRYDVFYPVYASAAAGEELPPESDANNKLMQSWLDALQGKLPDYKMRIEPSRSRRGSATLVSTAWMTQVFNTPAVTYEVGDETDRAVIRKVAEQGAIALMESLTKTGRNE